MKGPMILFNPLNKDVEFMYNHAVYLFKPGEKRLLDYDVVQHGLEYNASLKVYDGSEEESVKISENIEYEKLPWRKLVSIASSRGVYKPGISRKDLCNLLREIDEQRT